MRSHPPSLIALTRRTILDEALFAAGSRVLAAVSGGPDSMALLHVLARMSPELRFELVAHGVDHGLRADARRELDQAAAFAERLGVPWTRSRLKVPPGGNLQARARAERFGALRRAAQDARAGLIATAHHADDRAETLLLRLLRGGSANGLAVLPPKSGDLVRPFLRARRADIQGHIARHDIPFAEDPSNKDPRFLRTRVRYELMPLLATLSPGVVAHLNGLADDLTKRRELDASLEDPGAPPLPRATRVALAALATSGSKTGRVRLPHGLVVSFEASPPPRPRK